MMKKSSSDSPFSLLSSLFAYSSKQELVTKITTTISFLLILLGAFGLVFLQKPLREDSQDLRNQASVANGQVLVTTVQTTPQTGSTTIPLNQATTIALQVNTNGVQTDGIQVVFNIVTDTVAAVPTVQVASGIGLQTAFQEVQQTNDGFLISAIYLPQTIGSTFSTTTPTTFTTISFTPTTAGTITFNYDVDNSISTVHSSNPPRDELRIIPETIFTVAAATSPSPSSSPTASPTTSPSVSPTANPSPTATPLASATPTATPSPTPSATPITSASPTVTPSPTPTATPSIGGVTYRQCNESCNANTDCAANLRCYNNRCRLVTNVSNESCQEATVADNGLNRTCNQYCADTRECAGGYTCYYNRCRNPYNLEATSCAAPSQQVFVAMQSSCNQACNSHKDCAANLLCNASTKTCRLAINPSSYSCTAATDPTVSTIYTSATKGTDLTGGSSSSQSGTTSMGSTNPSPYKSTTYNGTTDTATSEDGTPLKEETALDSARNFIQKQLTSRGLNLPSIALAAGLILLIIIVLLSILANVLKGNSSQPPIIVAGKRREDEEKTKYEQQLSQKINTLSTQQRTGGVVIPPTPVVPGTPVAQPPQTLATNQPANNTTSMLDRLKDKGIQPPT